MGDAKDVTIQRLRSQLTLAYQLMTAYQRERHKRLSARLQVMQVDPLKKTGRPKKFNGHVPGQEGQQNERIDVC